MALHIKNSFQTFCHDVSLLWQGLTSHGQDNLPSIPTNAEAEEDTEHLTSREMILREFGRAARAWMVIYAIGFACLLGLRFQARDFYKADYQRKLALQEKAAAIAAAGEWWKPHEATIQKLSVDLRQLAKENDSVLKMVGQQQDAVRALKAVVDSLDLDQTSGIDQTDVNLSPNLLRLLQEESLANQHDSRALASLFSSSIRDLEALVSASKESNLNWTTLQAQLSEQTFGTKVDSRLPDGFVCPSETSETVAVSTPEPPKNAARQSDVDQRMHKVQAMIAHRPSNGINTILLSSTKQKLQDETLLPQLKTILDSFVSVSNEIAVSRKRQGKTGGSCWTQEEVESIVEEGLLALQTGRDLRNVLRKKVLELDASTTFIILDADLPPSLPKIPEASSVNLRRLVDTPLLQQVGPAVDQLVDLGGGYNDDLDQWLDSLAGTRESVGDVFVTYLLKASSQVEVPTWKTFVKEYVPTRLQGILAKQ